MYLILIGGAGLLFLVYVMFYTLRYESREKKFPKTDTITAATATLLGLLIMGVIMNILTHPTGRLFSFIAYAGVIKYTYRINWGQAGKAFTRVFGMALAIGALMVVIAAIINATLAAIGVEI